MWRDMRNLVDHLISARHARKFREDFTWEQLPSQRCCIRDAIRQDAGKCRRRSEQKVSDEMKVAHLEIPWFGRSFPCGTGSNMSIFAWIIRKAIGSG